METQDILGLACSGDEKSFEELIQMTTLKLKGLLISRYKLQPSDIDEIIQLATIKVFNKISSFRRDSSFTTWFFIILKNEALDFIRKRKLIESREVPCLNSFSESEDQEDFSELPKMESCEETASSILEKKELSAIYREMIEHVMEELSEQHKEVMLLSLEEGRSYKDIATQLNIPIGTVMSRLFFARKHAQQCILPYAKRNSIQLNYLGKRLSTAVS